MELLRAVGSLAEARRTRAYVVGGLVRDLFLGLRSEDLDIVVEESAVDFAGAVVESLGGAAKAHTRFGTVILVTPSGGKIDLATARSEVYERPGALPSVTAGGILEDLRRRDFTINAMAVLLNPGGFGELLDECGGRQDLRSRVLRVMTERSFEDDPTRILRGVRFAARFGMTFEAETERLLRRAVIERRTDTVSGERLMNELLLILREGDPMRPVDLLISWGILSSIVEEWDLPAGTTVFLARVLEILEDAREGDFRRGADRASALMLALLQPVESVTRDRIMERLSAGRRLRQLTSQLDVMEVALGDALGTADEPARSLIYRLLRRFSPETIAVAQAAAPDPAAARRLELYASELWDARTEIDGAALSAMGLPEGRAVGRILDAVLDARLDGLVSTTEEERALARRLVPTLTRGERTDNVAESGGTQRDSGAKGRSEGNA
jgi:tRNA nucleotidyltransferase (CCA-adding enzyme)